MVVLLVDVLIVETVDGAEVGGGDLKRLELEERRRLYVREHRPDAQRDLVCRLGGRRSLAEHLPQGRVRNVEVRAGVAVTVGPVQNSAHPKVPKKRAHAPEQVAVHVASLVVVNGLEWDREALQDG